MSRVDVVIEEDEMVKVRELSIERHLPIETILAKAVDLAVYLAQYKVGEVAIHVRHADGTEERLYPVL